eukprot:COSAG01_NODE_28269_length_665_cov_1.000000_1_plen_51_part_00
MHAADPLLDDADGYGSDRTHRSSDTDSDNGAGGADDSEPGVSILESVHID